MWGDRLEEFSLYVENVIMPCEIKTVYSLSRNLSWKYICLFILFAKSCKHMLVHYILYKQMKKWTHGCPPPGNELTKSWCILTIENDAPGKSKGVCVCWLNTLSYIKLKKQQQKSKVKNSVHSMPLFIGARLRGVDRKYQLWFTCISIE